MRQSASEGWSRFGHRLIFASARPPFEETWAQFRDICLYTCLPVVLAASLIGATATLMGFHAFQALGNYQLVGSYAGIVCLRELAPLLVGAMMAAKPGTAIAGSLASMRNSEQIDALEVMGVDPFRNLLAPRFIAIVLAAPPLLVLADVAAMGASYLTAVALLDVIGANFLEDLNRFVDERDVLFGVAKAIIFASFVGFIAGKEGYHAQPGSRGVARAVNHSVVTATLAIVLANVVLSALFYGNAR